MKVTPFFAIEEFCIMEKCNALSFEVMLSTQYPESRSVVSAFVQAAVTTGTLAKSSSGDLWIMGFYIIIASRSQIGKPVLLPGSIKVSKSGLIL
jgi:hypothetical protein